MKLHLGGHLNKTHVDRGVLEYVVQKYKIQMMVDIGCGPGGMAAIADSLNIEWIGIDGDDTVANSRTIVHDYTEGPLLLQKAPDLAYSTEFVEHVESEYVNNYMLTFQQAKYAIMTHALPGETGGHHHVNLLPPDKWIEIFGQYGFVHDPTETANIRSRSTMQKNFMRKTGIFFRR